MEHEKLKIYTARITQANRSELVVITYDLILDSIEMAGEAVKEENKLIYEEELKRIQKLLNELMGSLDYRFPIAKDLMQLYSFCNRKVVEALFQKNVESLNAVKSVIEKLKAGFFEIAKEDSSPAVMQNTQKLYAGLTYGKHALDEVFLSENESARGYKA